MVTDTPPDALRADQSPYMENVVLSQGVAIERGGWTHVGASDPLTASSSALASVRAVRFQGTDEDTLMVSTADGYVGVADATGNGVVFSNSGVVYYPRAYFRGEVIWCPQDGTSPIRRTVALTTTPVSGTGIYTIVIGQNRVEGDTSNFDPHVPVGSYIVGGLYRIVHRESDTQATISEPASFNVTGATVQVQSYGAIGLKTLVTDLGTLTHASGGSGNWTGKATGWNAPRSGAGAVMIGDGIYDPTQNLGAFRFPIVTAVGSGTSITTATNSVGSFTDTNYAILRNAVGREACVHRNTLWIAGVDWAPTRLYRLPLAAPLGTTVNPSYSEATEALDAAQLDYVDVPAPDDGGAIVALTSGNDALYVHKTDSLYRVTGEWPALNVQKIADYGTREIRAALAVDDGIYFAGTEGIFAMRGDGLQNLCDESAGRGGRLGEWRALINDSTTCILGSVRGHLFITTGTAPRTCWLFDLRNNRWCGNVTSESGASTGIEGAVYMDSPRDVTLDSTLEPVGTDRLLMVTGSTTTMQVGDVSTVIPDNPGGGVEVDSEGLGRFRADTPTNIAGAISRQRRVAGAKVSYVLAGDDAMTLDVTSTADEADTATPEMSLPSGDGYDVSTIRIPPTTGYIGALGRSFQMSITRSPSPTTSSRVAVHSIELVVGERRPRA